MAKRKLSPEKRAALREDLKKMMGGDKKTADVLREVSAKYGITTITARWYLKSIGVAPKARGGKRGPGRPAGSSSSGRLPKNLGQIVEVQSAKANEAKRLAPKWQRLIDRESDLRRQALKIERRLELVSRRAVKLERRIHDLIR